MVFILPEIYYKQSNIIFSIEKERTMVLLKSRIPDTKKNAEGFMSRNKYSVRTRTNKDGVPKGSMLGRFFKYI